MGARRFFGLARMGVYVSDIVLDKTALAIAQVKIPQTNKALRIAHSPHLVKVGEELLSPEPQGPGVVRGDILQVGG